MVRTFISLFFTSHFSSYFGRAPPVSSLSRGGEGRSVMCVSPLLRVVVRRRGGDRLHIVCRSCCLRHPYRVMPGGLYTPQHPGHEQP